MICTELDIQFDIKGAIGIHRPSGLHLTDIIRDIMAVTGMDKKYQTTGFSDREATMEAGFVWEDLLSMVFADRMVTRPEAILKDGIWCSPDGVAEDPIGELPFVVDEYKLTWKSVKKVPIDDWYWMTQAKSYCYVCGTTVVVFWVLHLNGDYRENFGPIRKTYRVEFSEGELVSNWEMIMGHADECRIK